MYFDALCWEYYDVKEFSDLVNIKLEVIEML